MKGDSKPNAGKFKIGIAKNSRKLHTKTYKTKVATAAFHKKGMSKPNKAS